jgi:hypothetical protein
MTMVPGGLHRGGGPGVGRSSTRTQVILVLMGAAAVGVAGWFLPVADWIIHLAELARQAGAAGVAMFIAVHIVSTVAINDFQLSENVIFISFMV